MVASLLAWQDYRVMGAIGCQSARAVCQEQDSEMTWKKQLCVWENMYSLIHTNTHTQIKKEIRVTSVSFIRQSFHWASGPHLLHCTEEPGGTRYFSKILTN